MGAIQSSVVNKTAPFIVKNGPGLVLDNETILTDASRTKALAQYTVMAYIAATGKWIPWYSVTTTDGSAFPAGILMTDGGFTAAQLVAGDVTGAAILVGGAALLIDSSQLVFDAGVGGSGGGLALTTAIAGNAVGSGSATCYLTINAATALRLLGIFCQTTILEDLAEN
jgi:hypothetical protein